MTRDNDTIHSQGATGSQDRSNRPDAVDENIRDSDELSSGLSLLAQLLPALHQEEKSFYRSFFFFIVPTVNARKILLQSPRSTKDRSPWH